MELVDVYNERHEKLNYSKGRKELNDGEYRLSCFIWIINDKNEILLQQRLATAKKMPNMWGTTAGGAQKGDSSLTGAMRELKEELGIDARKEEMVFIGSYKRINDFVEVWLCKKNIEVNALILEPSEVQDARWFSIDEFKRMIVDGKGIDSGFKIFEMYYDNFYNKHYELVDGKPVLVNNEK